ncbi:hypothetical protein [Lysinibacillus sp. SGAir0095]|uniref:hypothetical protein n=1 Tax=Lysinibacillus sp. SGAir0095 TaxID=2070463 RepID=UPI0010CCB998|nr:hypothetical protein [Lysinibacillus sp. SGAir0095]QCR33130.1 hypothetical protein C1N55_13480 [Lysinibacillus sp. SGAir0095]
MPFNVVLAKNAKVNGKRYKSGQTAENVSDELFEELEERGLVTSHEAVENNDDKLPDYKKITADQIKEQLAKLEIDFEGVADKKDLYALLEEALKKEGE